MSLLPRFLVFDDRKNVIDATTSLLDALSVSFCATTSETEAVDYIKNVKGRLVALVDKNIENAECDGIGMALKWSKFRGDVEWHIVTAFKQEYSDEERIETIGALWHDKGEFDLQSFVEKCSEGEWVEAFGPVTSEMELEQAKELAFEKRSLADTYQIREQKHKKIWKILSEPLAHQIMFDVEGSPCPEIELSNVRAVISNREFSTNDLLEEIESQTKLGVELVSSYLEVMQDLVYKFRGFTVDANDKRK